MDSALNSTTPATAGPKKYSRAVSPRLRRLLYVVFGLLAVLAANSIYLAAITCLEWATGLTYQDFFYLTMFMLHIALGLLLLGPFVVFGVLHMLAAKDRRNRRAVKIGYALFAAGLISLLTGLLLVRIAGVFDLRHPTARATVYWLHVICPLAAVWLYWLHRLAGPRIRWRVGLRYGAVVGLVIVIMVLMSVQDPRNWNVVGPVRGEKYFEPSLARTASGNFIPARALMMDTYCLQCHEDAHEGWLHSAHHFSSFNNPAYLATIRETRQVALQRDGTVQASRWCAGCHDPVPFFSGAFDDPKFDDVRDPTARAGVTCTACHSITHVNSTRGNADYTIEEPTHYPFAYSDNSILQLINQQLVKAKPSFHKKTFLKPFHKTAEFCSVCHKVHLPSEVTGYKDFLRGQNHYDSFLLSGVSGHGARSFYYPETAETNCNGCHMPLTVSGDFGARAFDGAGALKIHDHLFPTANTALPWLRDEAKIVAAHETFNAGVMRVDIFGLKAEGKIDGDLTAPLRPNVPELTPGGKYLLETFIRTLKMGHHFTQGTVDSNEVWLDVTVTSGDRVIGRSGGMDQRGEVDPWSHFVNVFMLDKNGDRVSRRNAQDIFVPLYDHQIPPGAGQVVHYALDLPEQLDAPVTVTVKLRYRKFDQHYMAFIAASARPGDDPLRGAGPQQAYHNRLPVMTLAVDSVTFPVTGVVASVEQVASPAPLWQRWNDYGIGLFLEGKAELRQAAAAFAEVEKLNRYDGPLNLARVYFREGRLDDAVTAARRASAITAEPPPPWTLAWLSGLVNQQQGHLDAAEENFRSVLEDSTVEMRRRRFDFSRDYVVINLLGQVLFDQAKRMRGPRRKQQRDAKLREALRQFQRTLQLDSENLTAHYNLALLYGLLGNEENAAEHQRLHLRFKPDDNARDRAVALARQQYPAANHAAEALVIYPLHREGAPELPSKPFAGPADSSHGGGP